MKSYNIAILEGDGIGPEIMKQAINVISTLGEKNNYNFTMNFGEIGGTAIDNCGISLPDKTLELCRQSDAILLAAVGGPKWDNLPHSNRPEVGLLNLRSKLQLFANIRHAKLFKSLKEVSSLRADIINSDIDIMIIRELTGGIYFGDKGCYGDASNEIAYDVEQYSSYEIERIVRIAFEVAKNRMNKVTSVDKSNILESSKLWRRVTTTVSSKYPEIELNHMYVDNASMQLVKKPCDFDVLVTTNMFGDILSDESAALVGSIGMIPSASLGNTKLGLYEPIHGSAPHMKDQDTANPMAMILSVALMMKYSFDLDFISKSIEDAISTVLEKQFRTKDIYSKGKTLVGTREMGELICREIQLQ